MRIYVVLPQDLYDFVASTGSCQVQRGQVIALLCCPLSAAVEQPPHDFHLPNPRCFMQRSVSELILGMYVRATLEEYLNDLEPSVE